MNTPYHLLTSTATIQTPTHGVDASYLPTTTSAGAASTIPCNVQPISADESLQFGRELATTMFTGLFAPVDSAGAAVSLTHDMALSINSVTYLVEGTGVNVAGKGVLIKATLKRQGGLT